MAINLHSDEILRNLRKEGETEYKIPRGEIAIQSYFDVIINSVSGGMFEYVSGANFFGEIIEWFGYFLVARLTISFFPMVFPFYSIPLPYPVPSYSNLIQIPPGRCLFLLHVR